MSESDLWKDIKKNIGHHGHFSRVESHSTSAGIPDVDFCIKGFEGHMELKFAREKLKKNFVRSTQVKWFRDRVKAGGRPWLFALLIIGGEKYYVLFKGENVGSISRETNIKEWVVKADFRWNGSMNWQELLKILQLPF